MFTQQDILIDALWIVGLTGLLITVIVALAYANARARRLGHVLSQPAILLPLCFSLTVFCSGLALKGYLAAQQAPLWETIAWGLLSLLFLSQTIFYGLSGRNRGWTTPVEGEKTVQNQQPTGNQQWPGNPQWSGNQSWSDSQQADEGLHLQNTEGASSPYMQLQNAGPDDRWQLVDETPQIDWQPIDYGRPHRTSTGWVLPSLIGVALVAVLGYMVWVGLERLGPGNINFLPVAQQDAGEGDDAQLAVTAEEGSGGEPEVAQLAAPQQQATSTPEAEEAAPVPTTPPSPTPTAALVERRLATINNQYGVNARREPSVDAEVIRIMPQGETAAIVDEREDPDLDGNWLQVLLQAEGELAWIASPFADITTELVPADPSLAVTADPPPSSLSVEATPPIQAQVTISSPAGLNARAAPNADSEIVAVLPNNNTYTAISRSEDGRWIEVQLEDAQTAWIFLELVIPSNDLNLLLTQEALEAQRAAVTTTTTVTTTAVTTATALVDTATPVTSTGAVTTTTPGTAPVKVPGDPFTSTVPAGANIVVSSTVGVNARSTSSTDGEVLVTLPDGTALSAVGRLNDGSWVQVVLPDSRLAWIFADAVITSPEVADLPVTTPPAVGEPAEQLEGTAPAAPDATADITGTAGITTTSDVTGTAPITATTGVTATVASLLGTAARPAPDTDRPPVQTVARGTELPVLGRTEDAAWLQVLLEDGSVVWVFATSVRLTGDTTDIPIITP